MSDSKATAAGQSYSVLHNPGEVLGKFGIRRMLGCGGMGVVYEAEHLLTKRIGALKLLNPSYSRVAQVRERFMREASAAGRIGNPQIVETLDAGELPSGEPYLFMELLRGQSLRDVLNHKQRLGLGETRAIALQTANGLAAAHAAQIIHRDIKPDNLFLCERDGGTFVKILDFGVSKFRPETASGAALTAPAAQGGGPLGTPAYMSPEQVVATGDLDSRTDIYSLAVVIYECLTGSTPFTGETLPALCVAIYEGHYPKLRQVLPTIPAEWEYLIERAMHRDRDQRHQSMLELAAELARLPLAELAPASPESRADVPQFAGQHVFHTTAPVEEEPVFSKLPEARRVHAAVPMPERAGRLHSRALKLVTTLLVVTGASLALHWAFERSNTTMPAPVARPSSPSVQTSTGAAPVIAAPLVSAAPTGASLSSAAPTGAPLSSAAPTAASLVSATPTGASLSSAAPLGSAAGAARAGAVSKDPFVKAQTRGVSPSPPATHSSRAARDGLSEQNPFSE